MKTPLKLSHLINAVEWLIDNGAAYSLGILTGFLVAGVLLLLFSTAGCGFVKGTAAYQIARGVGPPSVALYCVDHRWECLDIAHRYGPALRGEGVYKNIGRVDENAQEKE